jgi:putative ABC transport system ATP-binding protein
MATLQSLNDKGVTILVVTHEPDIAAFCRRMVSFQDGRLVQDEVVNEPRRAAQPVEIPA